MNARLAAVISATVLLGAAAPVEAALFYRAIQADPLTGIIIAINVALTIFFLVRFDRFAVVHGPEILTTTGIFGCFLGIALALLHFDTQEVSTSVPALLEGVKTAFWASVSGVAGALAIRLRHKVGKAPVQSAQAPKAANIDDLVAAMFSLQRSIAGSEDGTLLSQLKLMRQEQNDQLSALRGSFEKFATKMAEDGSKALIEALRAVIADFNAQINEQFGENFKNLNAAVEKLVVWQQEYRHELDRLQAAQRQSSSDLQASAAAFATVVQRSEAFAVAAASLQQTLSVMDGQQRSIESSLKSLAEVLVSMRDVAPQFAQKLSDLTDALTKGVAKVQGDVAEVVRAFGQQHQAATVEFKSLLTDTLRKSNADVNEQLLKNQEVIRQTVLALDKGLQEELTKSLQSLGRQLASLSEKFVADYGPLTEKLRSIVEMSKRV